MLSFSDSFSSLFHSLSQPPLSPSALCLSHFLGSALHRTRDLLSLSSHTNPHIFFPPLLCAHTLFVARFLSHSLSLTLSLILSHALSHFKTLSHSRAHTHVRTHAHAQTHNTLTPGDLPKLSHSCAHPYAHTYAHTYAHACTLTHAHTHAHTHNTHTPGDLPKLRGGEWGMQT